MPRRREAKRRALDGPSNRPAAAAWTALLGVLALVCVAVVVYHFQGGPSPETPEASPTPVADPELARLLDLVTAHRDDEARALLNSLQLRLPHHPDVLSASGILLNREGRFAEAEGVFRALLADQPEDAVLHYNLASVLVNRGDATGALAERRRALELDPARRFYHRGLCALLAEEGQTEDLFMAASRWRERLPGDGEAYYYLAVAQARLGRATEAVLSLRAALDREPNLPDARSLLSRLSSRKERVE